MAGRSDGKLSLGKTAGRRLLPALLLVVLALLPGAARGSVQETFTYSRSMIWNATVRLLRVDLGYEIAEQDADNGYILFVASQNGRTYNGSIEFVEGTGEYGIPTVDVTLSVNGLSRSAEDALIRKLKTKLRSDYGLAPRPEPPAPPPPVEEPEEDEMPVDLDVAESD